MPEAASTPLADPQQEAFVDSFMRPMSNAMIAGKSAKAQADGMLEWAAPNPAYGDADVWTGAKGSYPELTIGEWRDAYAAFEKIAACTTPDSTATLERLTAAELAAIQKLHPEPVVRN